VKVKMLAAPINPADFNMVRSLFARAVNATAWRMTASDLYTRRMKICVFQVQGVYGVTPKLPATAGNEGVGVVTAVGNNVKDLKQGDWVIPASPAGGFGTSCSHRSSLLQICCCSRCLRFICRAATWQTEFNADAQQLMKVPNDIPAPYAATIAVNPCTAYRMLRDFVELKPGDVIMQNGANSMVGQAVIQMAREMGVKTINIVREQRPNIKGVIRTLQGMGGDIVVPDSYVNTPVRGFVAELVEFCGCV
jgi:trans-2-enoyl-CoA reductase